MSKLLDLDHYNLVTLQDISLNGDASFNNDVFISNNLVTNNDIQCNNRLFILGDVSLNNDVYVKETLNIDGDASLNANLRVSNDTNLNKRLFVSGDVSLNSDLYIKEMLLVDGDVSLNANLKVSNDATLNDRLFVSNDASFNNDVFVSNNLVTNNDIQCNNNLLILGDVSWNPNNLATNCIPSTAVIGGAGGSSAFSANGDDIYFNNGNVGIGTTSPGSKLHIHDNTLPSIRLSRDDNSHNGFQIYSTSSAAYVCTKEDQPLHFETNLSTRMTIKGNGNIGIGIDNPNRRFVIYQDSYPTLQIINSAGGGTGSNNGLEIFQGGNSSVIANRENGNMTFRTNNHDRIKISSTGNVGINSTSPSYPLHIEKTVSDNFSGSGQGVRWLDYTRETFDHHGSKTMNTSIYTTGSIITSDYFAALSDRRIKKDIIELNDDTALEQIRLLKPASYKYKDFVNKGSEEIIGFIAQEVLEAIPQAVRILTGEIPNILLTGSRSVDSSGDQIITIPEYDTSALEQDASGNIFSKLKIIIDENNTDKELFVNILEVVSATELKIEILDSEITELPSEIFIYGQEVDNKHVLVKDRIFAVATSALQEIDRQLQAEKTKVATLESENATLKTQIADVLQRLSNAGI